MGFCYNNPDKGTHMVPQGLWHDPDALCCACLQKDVHDMERALQLWCPEEHRERMRFAVTECGAIDWGGAKRACKNPSAPGLASAQLQPV